MEILTSFISLIFAYQNIKRVKDGIEEKLNWVNVKFNLEVCLFFILRFCKCIWSSPTSVVLHFQPLLSYLFTLLGWCNCTEQSRWHYLELPVINGSTWGRKRKRSSELESSVPAFRFLSDSGAQNDLWWLDPKNVEHENLTLYYPKGCLHCLNVFKLAWQKED